MSTDKPTISVIIPTYNRRDSLERAVKSVLYQTHTDFELIIVDDSSTDETRTYVKTIDDDRVQLLVHEENQGGGAARNTGISEAKGELIAFLDSDDIWTKNKLERSYKEFQKSPKADIIYSTYFRKHSFQSRLKVSSRNWKSGILQEELAKGWHPAPTSFLMFRTSALVRVGGFDEDLPSYQDNDILLRLGKFAYFDYVESPLGVKFENESDQISTDIDSVSSGIDSLEEKWEDEIISKFGEGAWTEYNNKRMAHLQWRSILESASNRQVQQSFGIWLIFVQNPESDIKEVLGGVLAIIGGIMLYHKILGLYYFITAKKPESVLDPDELVVLSINTKDN